MINRFSRIHREFGFGASGRTALLILIVGLVGMPILGVFALGSWWPALIVVAGLVVGALLRRHIVEMFEWTAWALPVAGIVYGVLLFAGERIGLSQAGQLIFITRTTVVFFDLQFWSLSDPSIVKVEDDG